jgi:hypothetical protein
MSLLILFSGGAAPAAPFVTALSQGVGSVPAMAQSMVLGTFAALLAATPAPVTNTEPLPAPQHLSQRVSNADTSQGMPAALAASIPAASNQPRAAVVSNGKTWPAQAAADALKGTPITLLGATPPPPVVNPPLFAVDRVRATTDTSQSAFAAVNTVVVVQNPFTVAPQLVVALNRTTPDTSQGTPKALYGDQQPPLVQAPFTAPDRLRPVTDTSTGSSVAMLSAVVPPVVNLPTLTPDKIRQTLADTSQRVVNGLTPDAQPPLVNPSYTAPDRLRPVTDTSTGSSIALVSAVVPPVVNLPTLTPDRIRQTLADTSQRVVNGLTPDQVPPLVNPAYTAPDRLRPVTDTSQSAFAATNTIVLPPFVVLAQPAPERPRAIFSETSEGTPKVLYADQTPPLFNAPYTAPDRIRPVTDTSQSSSTSLLNAPTSFVISAERANLIYQIALLHGLDPARPMSVNQTSRVAGGLNQTITGSGTPAVTITTNSLQSYTGSIDAWIDALAALHALTAPLVVTSTTRDAGAVHQTMAVTAGPTTTVTTS